MPLWNASITFVRVVCFVVVCLSLPAGLTAIQSWENDAIDHTAERQRPALRHANVTTTATYYIKTAADDVRKAMTKLENQIAAAGRIQSDTDRTPDSSSNVEPSTIQ